MAVVQDALPAVAPVPPAEAGPEIPSANSPAIRDLVARLQKRFGARCRVVPRSATGGKLEIEYTSLEELDGILAHIQ